MIDNSDDCDSYDHYVFCDSSCSSSSSTQCTVGHQYYHLKCCGLEDDLAQYAIRISKFMGWTCEACRLLNTATIKDLQRELASLRITVSSLQSALDKGAGPSENNSKSSNVKKPLESHANPTGAQSSINTSIKTVVYKTLRDANRRSKNIVISGG